MRQLKDIVGDREKGAGELLAEALQWMGEVAAGRVSVDRETILATLRNARPIMPAFAVLAERLEAALRGEEPLPQVVQQLKQEWEQSEHLIAQSFSAVVAERRIRSVTTISWSSAVRKSLVAAQRSIGQVYVLRSEPGGEGVRTAEWLKQHAGFEIRLVEDEDMVLAVEKSDAVVLGADAIIPGVGVINKVKSCALARCAAQRGRPVLVLGSRWKISHRCPEELMESEASGFFELVPQQYISVLITEELRPTEQDS